MPDIATTSSSSAATGRRIPGAEACGKRIRILERGSYLPLAGDLPAKFLRRSIQKIAESVIHVTGGHR